MESGAPKLMVAVPQTCQLITTLVYLTRPTQISILHLKFLYLPRGNTPGLLHGVTVGNNTLTLLHPPEHLLPDAVIKCPPPQYFPKVYTHDILT